MRPVNRRTFLKAAGGVVAAGGLSEILLSGCAPAVNTGAKKTLNFWAFTDTRTAWQKKAFEVYKKQKNPDFEINWVVFPYQQMHDKILITALGGSGGPDIADIEISQFSRYIKGDVIFADLAPKLQQMGELDNFYQASATDPWSWQGKIYGLGNELNTCLLSYRWDVWQKAGVKTPIETWDEFAQEAIRFHKDTGNYLLDMPFDDSRWWWLMTLQQGGGFFGPNGQPTLNSPVSINTLTYQKKALTDGWSLRTQQSLQSYNVALAQGQIATLLGPSWNFSGFVQQNIPQTKGKWHLQPMPRWTADGSRTATWGGTGVSVLKISPYVEEAIDFVTFEHTTPEALLNDFQIRQVWPTYKPAFNSPLLNQPLPFFDNQKVGDLIKEVSPEIPKWYNSPYWPETTDALTRLGVTNCLLNPDVTPEQALNDAQNQAKKIIGFETA
ncbi:MAG TPA: extracellular solute-binding protein [Ktedonobacteraceae bacterium]|nr:extracellular solute-binding protein [Ktedonobacteraceae bacterium]